METVSKKQPTQFYSSSNFKFLMEIIDVVKEKCKESASRG